MVAEALAVEGKPKKEKARERRRSGPLALDQTVKTVTHGKKHSLQNVARKAEAQLGPHECNVQPNRALVTVSLTARSTRTPIFL